MSEKKDINPATNLPRADEDTSPASDHQQGMRVIALGTAGGPLWWKNNVRKRQGIATAVVVDDRFYVVDAGYGAGQQIRRAGLDFQQWSGTFITHLHSDHTVDLPGLMIFGMHEFIDYAGPKKPIFGPGDRGMLPPVTDRAIEDPTPVAPENPTPGTVGLFQSIVEGYATDLNDRVLDSLRPSPEDIFEPVDIKVPHDIGYHPNDNPTPTMDPMTIFEDDKVKVTAILVEHPPIAPAFAFRFDSQYGSVTISGDTAETPNMVTLAKGTDLLMHEAIDFGWVEDLYGDRTDDEGTASRDHHYKSHTSIEGAVRTAQAAEAQKLALHHVVPSSTPLDIWHRGKKLMPDQFFVPDDLDILEI